MPNSTKFSPGDRVLIPGVIESGHVDDDGDITVAVRAGGSTSSAYAQEDVVLHAPAEDEHDHPLPPLITHEDIHDALDVAAEQFDIDAGTLHAAFDYADAVARARSILAEFKASRA